MIEQRRIKRGLRPLAFSCRCTPKSIDDHPCCKAIVDQQGGRSNDASSVNQAISFREEANEDTAWTTIDFLLTILSWKSLHQSRGAGGFRAVHREKKPLVALFASRCEIVLLLPSIDITGEENVEDLDIEKKNKKIYLFIYLYFLVVISLQGF